MITDEMLGGRLVVLDGDAILYLGALRVVDHQITVENTLEMMEQYIGVRLSAYQYDGGQFVITHPDSPKGGRYDVYENYQSGRAGNEKSPVHQMLIQGMCNGEITKVGSFDVVVEKELEADDYLVRYCHENDNVVCMSADKDIKQVKGEHVGIKPGTPVITDDYGFLQKDGNKYLFTGFAGFVFQTLAGDAADGIPPVVFPPSLVIKFMPTKAQLKAIEAGKEPKPSLPKKGLATAYNFIKWCSDNGTTGQMILKGMMSGTMPKEDVMRNAQLVYMQRGLSIREYTEMFGGKVIEVK